MLFCNRFIVSDFFSDWPEASAAIKKLVEEKKFVTEGTETKVEASFDEIPKVWKRLFSVRPSLSLPPAPQLLEERAR